MKHCCGCWFRPWLSPAATPRSSPSPSHLGGSSRARPPEGSRVREKLSSCCSDAAGVLRCSGAQQHRPHSWHLCPSTLVPRSTFAVTQKGHRKRSSKHSSCSSLLQQARQTQSTRLPWIGVRACVVQRLHSKQNTASCTQVQMPCCILKVHGKHF